MDEKRKKTVDYFERRFHDVDEIQKAPDSRAPNVISGNLTKRQLEVFGSQNTLTCASCEGYQHRLGQQEIADQDFARVLVHDYEWKLRHLCADIRDMALCSKRDGLLVGPMSKACELYKPSRGGVRIALSGKGG